MFSTTNPRVIISKIEHLIIEDKSYKEILVEINKINNINCFSLQGNTLLTIAITANNSNIVNYLIYECEADINFYNSDYSTPLHHAIFRNNTKIFKILLQKGADLWASVICPTRYDMPIVHAFEYNKNSIVKLMLKYVILNYSKKEIEELGLEELIDDHLGQSGVELMEKLIERKIKAENFCQQQNINELKDYLSNCPIPYNHWKNATNDQLKRFVMDLYK